MEKEDEGKEVKDWKGSKGKIIMGKDLKQNKPEKETVLEKWKKRRAKRAPRKTGTIIKK